MSALQRALADYLAVRRALGFKLTEHGYSLVNFVNFVERTGASTVSTELALVWAQGLPQVRAYRQRQRLAMVHDFAAYLHTLDPAAEVPPKALLPNVAPRRATPYLYSDAEINALIAAAETLSRPLEAATMATVIGLLAVTGMRVGEVIGLDRTDVDCTEGLLTVRNGKFGNSRELPLHPTTVEALCRYVRQRKRLAPRSSAASFFVSPGGTRLSYGNVSYPFAKLRRAAGITQRPSGRLPRIHDLRHTFAVNTLVRWYRQDLDIVSQLPALSTYLGHCNPAGTYWYLSATPELFGIAARRLERAREQRP